MNFPQTVDELIHWDTYTETDKYGQHTVITGYEGTGGCYWCGAELTGRQWRFCGHRSGHWTLYAKHFYWSYARAWCIERYEGRCANCGRDELEIYQESRELYHWDTPAVSLQAHHIIPLEGANRAWSVYNVPWNLICLCHYCHLLIHAVMRESSRSAVLDVFDLATARGQAVFEPLR